MSKELTEKWKNGTLNGGIYYLLLRDGTTVKDKTVYIVGEKQFRWHYSSFDFVKEVLAKVPTYEEWVKEGTWYTEKSHNELLKKIEELEQKIHILNEANMNMENTIGKFGEQLNEANELLWKIQDCREDREYYSEQAYNYLEKWGVK